MALCFILSVVPRSVTVSRENDVEKIKPRYR